jgi:SAM-dependent methyltransferase
MRETALAYLACPACRRELSLEAHERAGDGHVLEGELGCASCGGRFPIRRGVPRFASDVPDTAARFGEQWKTFRHMARYQEAWLKAWLDPLGPADFAGKAVLEAGCGKGRHTVVVAGWGARAIVALDLGDAVDVAFEHTRAIPSVHVVQGDLLAAPVRGAFDVVFSVGVLHHLPEPRAGFEALRPLVRPGGKIAVWVYGRESNEWIVRYVDPVRLGLTARITPRALYWLSLPPSAALALATRVWRRWMPYGEYLAKLGTLPLREVHNIVFDQLVAPIAHYLPEDEVRRWFASDDLTEVRIAWHNRNSWRGSATVTASTANAAGPSRGS